MASGRIALGFDVNPISTMVSRAKTLPLDGDALIELRELYAIASGPDFRPTASPPPFRNLSHWFDGEVAEALAGVLAKVRRLEHENARILALTAFSSILVSVSRQDSETRWARIDRDVPIDEVYNKFSRRLREALERTVLLQQMPTGSVMVATADARALPLQHETIDLVVTSPPYANSHDYYLYHKLRLFWLGHNVRTTQEAEFGSRNKHSDQKLSIEHYFGALSSVLRECARVQRVSGRTCFVVGDAVIRGEFFNMGEHVPKLAFRYGLKLRHHFRFGQQRYTKAFMRTFGTRQSKSTHVLIFGK